MLPPAQQSHVQQQNSMQPIQSNDMKENFTGLHQKSFNLHWQQGQPIGAPHRTFRQIKYLSHPNAVLDLDQALSGARLDCGRDLHQQLIEYGGAAKVWMTLQVEYEPVNLLANKSGEFRQVQARRTNLRLCEFICRLSSNPHRSDQGI